MAKVVGLSGTIGQWSGFKQYKRQRKWCEDNGIDYVVNRLGEPLPVERDEHEAQPAQEPNLDGLRKRA